MQIILQIQHFEDVVTIVHRQLSAIGIEGHIPTAIGAFDAGIVAFIQDGQTVTGTFSRSCFQIVVVTGDILKLDQAFTQIVHHPDRKCFSLGLADVHVQEVFAGFIHADDADGGKVVFPILLKTLTDILQIKASVWIKTAVCVCFQYLALDLQGGHGDGKHSLQPGKEILFVLSQKTDARQIQGYHSDRAGQRVRAKEPASTCFQFTRIQAQTAAHAARVIGIHIAIHEVREIGNAIFSSGFPQIIQGGIFPVKPFGNVICRDGESEDAAFGIAFGHHFQEGFVKDVHFWLKIAVASILRFAADDHGLIFVAIRRIKIHGDIGKGSLEAYARGDIDIEDKLLQGLLDLVVTQLVIMNEGGQQRVKAGKSLRACRFALQGIEEIDDLSQSTAEMFGGRALHLAFRAAESG